MAQEFARFYFIENNLKLAICKEHHTAIPKRRLLLHLKEEHLVTDHEIREYGLKATLRSLDLNSLEEASQALKSQQPVRPLPFLPRLSGRECNYCGQLSVSEETASRHVREEHGIYDRRNQGPCFSSCSVQTICSRKLFKVLEDSGTHGSSGTSTGSEGQGQTASARTNSDPNHEGAGDEGRVRPSFPAVRSVPSKLSVEAIANIRASFRESLKPKPVDNRITLTGSRGEMLGFHAQTGYPEFLKDRDLIQLKELFWLHGPDPEVADSFLSACIEYIFVKTESILPFLSKQVGRLLNSFSRERTSSKAFKELQERSSKQRYGKVLRAFLIFLLNSLPYQVRGSAGTNPELKALKRLYRVNENCRRSADSLRHAIYSPRLTHGEPQGDSTRADGSASHSVLDVGGDDEEDDDSDDDQELDMDEADSENEDSEGFAHHKDPSKIADQQMEDSGFDVASIQEGVDCIERLLMNLASSQLNMEQTGPIYAFFACYSVHYDHMCMKRVDMISHAYSAFIYCMQLVVLDFTWSHWSQDIGESEDAKVFVAENPFEGRIRPWLDDYLKHQSPYPMGDILSSRAYALSGIRLLSTIGNEVCELGPHHLRHDELELTQEELRQFFQRFMLDLARHMVGSLLLHGDLGLFNAITPSKAASSEDIAKNGQGFNFIVDNSELVEYGGYILDRILRDGSSFQDWFQMNEGSLRILRSKADQYLSEVDKFLKRLLAMVHMSSGAPARGTEIVPILYADSIISPRNLFLDPRTKLFMIRLHYSKTMAVTGKEMNAVRSLPAGLTHILLVYLVVVEPFVHFLHETLKIPNRRGVLFSVRNRLPQSERISRTMHSESMAYIGKGLRLGSWRQLSQGFIRYGMGEAFEQNSGQPSDVSRQNNEAPAARQANQTVRTGQLSSGRPQVRLPSLPVNRQRAFVDFSRRWHEYIGLSPDYDILGLLEVPVERPRPQRIRRALTFRYEGPVGLLTPEHPCLRYFWPPRDGNSFHERLKVGQFDRFLALASPDYLPGDLVPSRGDTGFGAPGQEGLDTQLPSLSSVTRVSQGDILLTLLREFLGDPEAEFRVPEQRQVLYHILAPKPCLVSILPTAGVMTILFLLAASLAWSKTTILVVPSVALKQDLRGKLERLGLPHAIWEDLADPIPALPLILVSFEDVLSHDFQTWVRSLFRENKIDRIVFEDAHLVILAQNYQPIMEYVSYLVEVQVPLVFASATMTPGVVGELINQLRISPQDSVLVRGDINRTNIRYSVLPVPPEDLQKERYCKTMMDVVSTMKRKRMASHGKCIVYVNAQWEVEQFKEEFPGVAFYHAKLSDQVQREQFWLFQHPGGADILVGTGGLNEWIDFQGVGMTVHVGCRWGMNEFLQSSGRVAWDEEKGLSVVIVPEGWTGSTASDSEQSLFLDFVQEKICRRRVIQREYNGKIVGECQRGERACDLCTQRHSGIYRNSECARMESRVSQHDRASLEEMARFFTEQSCIHCVMSFVVSGRDPSEVPGHSSLNCPEALKTEDFRERREGRNNPPKDSCCSRCLLPTVVCRQSRNDSACLLTPGVLQIFMLSATEATMWTWFEDNMSVYCFGVEEDSASARLDHLMKREDGPFGTETLRGVLWFFGFCRDYFPFLLW